jgi:hypothetical protein
MTKHKKPVPKGRMCREAAQKGYDTILSAAAAARREIESFPEKSRNKSWYIIGIQPCEAGEYNDLEDLPNDVQEQIREEARSKNLHPRSVLEYKSYHWHYKVRVCGNTPNRICSGVSDMRGMYGFRHMIVCWNPENQRIEPLPNYVPDANRLARGYFSLV